MFIMSFMKFGQLSVILKFIIKVRRQTYTSHLKEIYNEIKVLNIQT